MSLSIIKKIFSTMDHSAGSYMYDPQGRLRLYNRYASGAPALAADVKLLLKGN